MRKKPADNDPSPRSNESRELAEAEIVQHVQEVDYDTKEYPVETIVAKYLPDSETGDSELFIPDYQREMTWDEPRQSKFIESVLIGLPIPYLFVADIGDEKGRLEIVDGTQRIRTLANFLSNKLVLTKLQKIASLNGFRFSDLVLARQRRFRRRTLRMIELTEKANEEIRRDIFERINTGSVELAAMEKRRGIRQGPMLNVVEKCAAIGLFHKLAPLTPTQRKRRDGEELVLRFFAYSDRYDKFKNRVDEFLDEFLKDENKAATERFGIHEHEFVRMLEFVDKHFPYGFAKGPNNTTTPRIRYESIAVGANLALRAKPNLVPQDVASWLSSDDFSELTTAESSNSAPRVRRRIEFVRDRLLGIPQDGREKENE